MFKNMDKNALSVICFAFCICLMICVDIFSVNFSSIILILAGLVIGISVTAINGKKSKEIKETNTQSGEQANSAEQPVQTSEQTESNENSVKSKEEKVNEYSVNEEESK